MDVTPVVIVFAFCAVPVLIVIFVIKAQQARQKLEHDERMLALEKGMEIPPSLIKEPIKEPKFKNPYAASLVWIGIGVGAGIFGFAFPDSWLVGPGFGAFSAIPICIGIALLIANILNQKRIAKEKITL